MKISVSLLAVLAMAAAGCSSRTAAPPAAGRRIAEGPVLGAVPSPDGARVAWLSGCGPAAGGTGGRLACRLLVAPVAGGAPAVAAEGVSPSPPSFAWAPDGALAAVARLDPASGAGDLVVRRGAEEARVLARRVTGFAFGPTSDLAFVSGGDLFLAAPSGAPVALKGGAGAGAFAFAPAPGHALAAQVRSPGGAWQLVLWRAAGEGPEVVARDADGFAFSGDGALLAAIAGIAPGTAGDLVVVPVAGGAAPRVVARGVGEFRWAPGANRLAWLAGLDPRVRAGTLAADAPGGAATTFGAGVTSFELAQGGERIAWVRHVTDGGYAANLEISPVLDAAAGTVAPFPAGFEFSPDGRWLWYRAACAPSGDGCALFRVPAAGLGPSQAPERVADGVSAVVLDRARPDRALVAFARADGAGVDLSAWSPGGLAPLARNVVPGSARFLPPDGRRALYAVAAPGPAGLYVADVP